MCVGGACKTMAAPEAVAVMMPLKEAEDSIKERLRKEG